MLPLYLNALLEDCSLFVLSCIIKYKMLHKNFLPVITSWLSRKYIINVHCSTLINDSSPIHQKKPINTVETKELVEKTELSKVKEKGSKETQLKYIKHSISQDKEILDIINCIRKDNPNIIDSILSTKWIFKKREINTLHLIDRDTGAKYVSLINNDLSKNMCYVAEIKPGFGVLTRELLKAGVPLIHLYESNLELREILEIMCAKYPGKLNLISLKNSNFLKIIKAIYYNDKITDEKYEDNFKVTENKTWEDDTYMQVIGASDDKNLFTFIIHSLIFRNSFMFHGRPTFYLAILPSMWHKYSTCTISNKKIYSYTKVMFKLMFNYELLGTLNRKAFIPWSKEKCQYKYNTHRLWFKQDYEQMFVIKFEPKADLYSQLPQKDWITFSYFVKYFMQKRCNRVIPALEKWIPDCGIRLIAKDYMIYTQFGDLTPIQILELFKEFKSWPEYKESHFISSMNDSLGAHKEIEFLND